MSVSPNSFLPAYAASRLAETSSSGQDASPKGHFAPFNRRLGPLLLSLLWTFLISLLVIVSTTESAAAFKFIEPPLRFPPLPLLFLLPFYIAPTT